MAGKAYGKTLPFGFRGAVSRQPDTLIQSYTNTGDANIEFGAPVVFDATNGGVRKIASGDAATAIIGFAVRRMGQPYADDPKGYYYKKAIGCVPHKQVCVDPADGELTSVQGSNLAVPNTVFATGNYDSNNVAEITVLSRNI